MVKEMISRKLLLEQLSELRHDILAMATRVEENLGKSLAALKTSDAELAKQVSLDDAAVDALQKKIEDDAAIIIATQQPVARDLRELVAIFRIISNIERAGDHAVHLAKAAKKLAKRGISPFKSLEHLERMAGREMLRAAVEAFLAQDANAARKVAEQDNKIDEEHKITTEDPEIVSQALNITANTNVSYAFLQFNYTHIFDNFLNHHKQLFSGAYQKSINSNLHLHGELDNRPIMGVDSKEQILNEKLRTQKLTTVFVKPLFLNAIQARDKRVIIPAIKARDVIQTSKVICVFGASVGYTDKTWWKDIGTSVLRKHAVLVVFDYCGDADDGVSPLSFLSRNDDVNARKKEIFDRITELAEWTHLDKELCKNKVIIELDSGMFNFKLPRKA